MADYSIIGKNINFSKENAYVAIGDISRKGSYYDVYLDDLHLYLIKKGGSWASDFVGRQFGLLGVIFGALFNRSQQRKSKQAQTNKTIDEIIAEDDKSVMTDLSQARVIESRTGMKEYTIKGMKPIFIWNVPEHETKTRNYSYLIYLEPELHEDFITQLKNINPNLRVN